MHLLTFLFCLDFLPSILFLANFSISPAIAPISFIIAALSLLLITNKHNALWAVLCSAGVIAASATINYFIYDSTFDGIGYHYDSVVMLADGWNPVYETPWNGSIWNRCYAKALEVQQAAILSITNNLQTTKCVNFIFAASALSVLGSTLKKVFPAVSTSWRAVIVVMAAANPIALWQLTSAYNDYAIWIETILFGCSFLLSWHNPKSKVAYAILFITFTLAINTKFTHFVIAGLECLFFAFWCIYYKRMTILRRGCLWVTSAVVVGVGVMGYNPYITNTLEFSSPIYPLGTDEVDIMTGNTPDMFVSGNRLTNLVKSNLSLDNAEWALLKGSISTNGIRNCYSNSMRVNGFGILMSPLLILGFILMCICRPSLRWWTVYSFAFFLSITFEQSWWARYIPVLWLAVILPVLLIASAKPSSGMCKRLSAIIFVLSMINGGGFVAATACARISYSTYFNYVLTTAKKQSSPLKVSQLNFALRQQLMERDVPFVEFKSPETFSHSETFRLFGIDNFDSFVELPADNFPRLYAEPQTLFDKLARYPQRRYPSYN